MGTTLDLFCGCGGFSLGAEAAGFQPALAIDMDDVLSSAFGRRFGANIVMRGDVAEVAGSEIVDRLESRPDGVLGGPPCQAFSEIGRRSPTDPRRGLVAHFYRLVAEILPKFFVMENVRGIILGENAELLAKAIDIVRDDFHILGPVILDASEFGAATKRKRVFVVGIRKNAGSPLLINDLQKMMSSSVSVGEAIGDLKSAKFQGVDDRGFDQWTYGESDKISDYAKSLRSSGAFSGAKCTTHQDKTVERFSKVKPGAVDPIGRHPRLTNEGLCPTLRAGTGPDRGSFQSVRPIHPTEHRVITVREAARLQGFPDDFEFHPTTWHSFRMIGNSVSPIMSAAVLKAIRPKLDMDSTI